MIFGEVIFVSGFGRVSFARRVPIMLLGMMLALSVGNVAYAGTAADRASVGEIAEKIADAETKYAVSKIDAVGEELNDASYVEPNADALKKACSKWLDDDNNVRMTWAHMPESSHGWSWSGYADVTSISTLGRRITWLCRDDAGNIISVVFGTFDEKTQKLTGVEEYFTHAWVEANTKDRNVSSVKDLSEQLSEFYANEGDAS